MVFKKGGDKERYFVFTFNCTNLNYYNCSNPVTLNSLNILTKLSLIRSIFFKMPLLWVVLLMDREVFPSN